MHNVFMNTTIKILLVRLVLPFFLVLPMLLLSGSWQWALADQTAINNHQPVPPQPQAHLESEKPPIPVLTLELPVIDYPFNWSDGYTAPSMQQSLHVTKDVYQYSHYKLAQWLDDRPVARTLSVIGFDVVSLWLPFGAAWMHEEWHRAVLSHRGIDSFNEIYEFPLFAETISVKHVKDEDLIRLKRDYPADMVRLHAAGIESQYELNFALEKDRFYLQPPTLDDAILWLNYINNISYMYTCASDQSNTITDELMQQEDEDISERDFTGLDCNAWVYDLFRPDEPYEQRGTHPSGVGIKRYIKYDDLTGEEQDFLKTNFRLSLLNLVNPFLYRFEYFTATNPINHQPFRWNATLRHHITSFGYSIDANFFYQQKLVNAMAIFHHYFNKTHFFPGLELALVRYPVSVLNTRLPLSVRTSVWLQPKGQQFYADSSELGGIATLKFNFPSYRQWETFLELEAKTQGWVAGNVYLGDNVSMRLGVAAKLF
jgi:hypothetical protein